MSVLRDIQATFLSDIYTGEKSSAAYLNKSCSTERLNIFYNNTFLCLTEILAAAYPVLQRIVGEEYFRTIAHFYIKTYNQSTGNRHTYGRELSSFLNSYEPSGAWPYLSDIAAIEWAYFQSAIADDKLSIDFNTLTNLISESSELFLSLHPGVFYVELNYNSLEIWQEHQKNKIETIKLQESPQTILIWRNQNDEIHLQKVSESLKRLLICCQERVNFAQAMYQASDGLPDLTLFQQEFAKIVSSGVFVYKEDKK